MYLIYSNDPDGNLNHIGYSKDLSGYDTFMKECMECSRLINNAKRNKNPFEEEISKCRHEIINLEKTFGELCVLIKHNIDIDLNKQKCSSIQEEIFQLNDKIKDYKIKYEEIKKPDLSMFRKNVQEFSLKYTHEILCDYIYIEKVSEFEF